MLSAKRDTKAAKRFFRKMLKDPKHQSPRVINVDRNNAYPPAVEELKEEGLLAVTSQLRQCKYLNNIVEEDHRFMCAASHVVEFLTQSGGVRRDTSGPSNLPEGESCRGKEHVGKVGITGRR